jgi:RNA polymerase sigma factor (sigma-70 family)
MTRGEGDERLSQISTRWTLVHAAHGGTEDATGPARRELLEVYGRAIHRYLVGALRDQHAAEELFQEFALRFVRGDFRRADPGQGRFRYFVKAALSNLIIDYRKRQRRWPLPVIADGPASPDGERGFEQAWRDELLARAWKALAKDQARTGRPYYAVLRLRADHPDESSRWLADRLGTELGRPMTSAGVRQSLHRARERFAELLLDEVARSLNGFDPVQVEDELIELRLLVYCRSALERRGGVGRGGVWHQAVPAT